jgi:NDP-sugar pyrophosphorylase family protein
VNAGITLIDREALDQIDLLDTANFEIDLFSHLIGQRRTAHMLIDGYWYAIETQKDLEIANSKDQTDSRAVGARTLRDAMLRHQAALELGVGPD